MELYFPTLHLLDNFDNRQAATKDETTKKKNNKKSRSVLWIALHHFHPLVVSNSINVNNAGRRYFTFQHNMKKEFVQDNIPNQDDLNKYFFSSKNKSQYIPVPIYNIQNNLCNIDGIDN